MIGKHETKLYLEIVKMLQDEATPKKIRMVTGASDNYVAAIRKSLKNEGNK